MPESRLRWIALVALGVALTLTLRHMTSSRGAATAIPSPDGDSASLTIPVEIVEAGQAPRRVDVKIVAPLH